MRILIALVVLGLAVAAVAQPWRYVDGKGEVHITNDIMQLPPKQRERILKKMGLQADAGKSLPVGVGHRPGVDDRDGGTPPPPPPAVPAGPAHDETTAGAPPPPPASGPTRDDDEARWRHLVREAHERIADAETRREEAQAAFDQASRQSVLVTSGESLDAKAKAQQALDRAEAQVAAAKAALQALEEQARQQGVPPGWLR